jgi:hypothetical protein
MELAYTWYEYEGWYIGYLNDYPDYQTQGQTENNRVKRTELIKRITRLGAVFVRHGSGHGIYADHKKGVSQSIPRHNEITQLVIRNAIRAYMKKRMLILSLVFFSSGIVFAQTDRETLLQRRDESRLFVSRYGQFYYYEDTAGIRILFWNDNGETVERIIIPERINKKPVIAIDDECFPEDITAITLPGPLQYIGYQAFFMGDLTEIILPDGLIEIGARAFAANNLRHLEIPGSVTKIGAGAFELNRLETVVLSGGLTEIDEHTFQRNRISSITIPDTITAIHDYAFVDNPLTEISIGDNVRLGNYAFEDSRFILNNETSFYVVYHQNNKRGGRYIRMEAVNPERNLTPVRRRVPDYDGAHESTRTYWIWVYQEEIADR